MGIKGGVNVSPDLKPCPFCGGSEIEIVYCDQYCCGAKPIWIQCLCGCELAGMWNTDSEAIASWNQRKDDE